MTDNEKYQELLKEVGAMFKEKNDRITILEWQLADMKRKVEELESEKVCKRVIEKVEG